MNKILLATMVVVLSFACDTENNPQPDFPKIIPVRMEEPGFTQELIYDAAGKLIKIISVSKFVDGSTFESTKTFAYNPSGRLLESVTSNGWRTIYSYDNADRVVQADEYENDVWEKRFVYAYNERGLLSERVTFQQKSAGETGIERVSKETYLYDSKDNVAVQKLFEYTESGTLENLLTIYTFSDYDEKLNTDAYFGMPPYYPSSVLKKRNPGKLVIQNSQGFTTSIETYSYQYNDVGYASEKTSRVTFYNGNTGSYVTKYSFKNR
jgi:YD repeat-containing protein